VYLSFTSSMSTLQEGSGQGYGQPPPHRRGHGGGFKAIVNEVGPPQQCLLSRIWWEASERPTRRRQSSERVEVQYHCTTL